MNGYPDFDLVEDVVRRLKELHIQALENISDDELNAAIAFFRPSKLMRHVPSHEDMMTYYLLSALRAFRSVPPIEPGDSPFEYRKEVTDKHRDQQK